LAKAIEGELAAADLSQSRLDRTVAIKVLLSE